MLLSRRSFVVSQRPIQSTLLYSLARRIHRWESSSSFSFFPAAVGSTGDKAHGIKEFRKDFARLPSFIFIFIILLLFNFKEGNEAMWTHTRIEIVVLMYTTSTSRPFSFFFSILILPRHTTQREERERKRGTSCQVLMRKHEDVQRKRKTVFLLRLLHCVACLILLFFFRLRVSACVCSSYNLFRGSKPDLIVECVYYIRPSKRERDRGRHRERVFFPSFFIHDVATVTMTATTATAKERFFFTSRLSSARTIFFFILSRWMRTIVVPSNPPQTGGGMKLTSVPPSSPSPPPAAAAP